MADVSFISSNTPLALPTGIPSLTTDEITTTTNDYNLEELSEIKVYLNITTPAGGASKLNIGFGPATEVNYENLTGLHNSFQGNIPLNGITYATDREVYSLPLSHWIPFVTNPFTWKLWVYNWDEASAGTLVQWWVTYTIGVDVTPPVVPLNPVARELGRYYGVGSNVSKDIVYTLKELTIDGVVGYAFPIYSGATSLRSAFYSALNSDVSEATLEVELVRNRGDVETVVWTGTITAPVGYSRGTLGSAFGSFINGDTLYFRVVSATTTSVDLVIQATVSEE